MILERIQIRYYPPGLNLKYRNLRGATEEKQLDLYGLDCTSQNQDEFLEDLILQETQLLEKCKKQLQQAVTKILQKYQSGNKNSYKLKKSLQVHQQPLTNCAFNKYGDKFATASYDRTCKIWDTNTGNLLTSLKGHRNAVFCLDFSRFSQKQLLATGSLDHGVKLWSSSGTELWTLKEHKGEVTDVKFNPNGAYLTTCSFDQSVIVWDIEKGKKVYKLEGHEDEVIKIQHNYHGDLVLSGSFDNTAKIWDLKTGKMVKNLQYHSGEINSCKFQFTGEICATAGNDKTCIIWDIGSAKPLNIFTDHSAEVYDIDFNKKGDLLVSGSADRTANVYNVNTSAKLHTLQGHKGEVTRVLFTPQGNQILTTGMDGIGRIWQCESGKNTGLLEGHSEQIFSCDINYYGQHIITCSKDNVCNIWDNSI